MDINRKHLNGLIAFLLVVIFIGRNMEAQTLRVASFNLRYDNPADSLNNWKYRKDNVGKLIQFHDFDIFGSQEALKHQLDDLSEELSGYTYIGVGRDDGKESGEYTAIFYKDEQFKLLRKGNFWLAEDPTQPEKGWDAALPRICTWGKFEDKTTGFQFYFFNTHFDHVGTTARRESAKLILNKITEIAGKAPTILAGDFNVDQNSESYKELNSASQITDSYDKARFRYGAEGTFSGFEINSRSSRRIDHVFVSKEFEVLKHAILTDTYKTSKEDLQKFKDSVNHPREMSFYENKARLPSDHYPVFVLLKY